MMAFQLKGRLPKGVRPASPLLDVLRRITPMDRSRMLGFLVDEDLGYQGARRFPSVGHALHWLAPAEEVFGSFPAESCRIRAFARVLTFEDVAAACQSVPDDVRERYGKKPQSQDAAS